MIAINESLFSHTKQKKDTKKAVASGIRPLMPLLLILGLAQALPQNHPAALTAAGAAVLQSSEPGESGGAHPTVELSTKTKICSDCSAAVTAVKTYVQNHIDNHASGSTEADNIAYFKQKSVSEWSTDCARDVLDDGATETDCNYIFSQILDQGDLGFMTLPNDEICTALTSYPCTASYSDAFLKFRASREMHVRCRDHLNHGPYAPLGPSSSALPCLHRQCHPPGSYLTLEEGKSIAIERATVGTLIKTPTGFQPILGFLHDEEDLVMSYLRFTTPSASMAISPLHHAFVNGAEIDPSFIKLGDLLHTPHGLEPVTRIEPLEARGAYHILVKGGSYYVDGILASDYVAFFPRAIWSLGCAYAEARYWLGVPLIPIGKGFFPNHAWADDLMGRAGVPFWARKSVLFPLFFASSILTELANVAAERFPAWLGTAAAAIAVGKAGRKLRA